MRNKLDMIRKGFDMAEIAEAVNMELEPEDLFEDLVRFLKKALPSAQSCILVI